MSESREQCPPLNRCSRDLAERYNMGQIYIAADQALAAYQQAQKEG